MQRGMTLTETFIVGFVVAGLVSVLGLVAAHIREELKNRRAAELMAILNEALVSYHKSTGAWPADQSPRKGQTASNIEDDGSGDRIINILAELPESRTVLERIPPPMRIAPSTDADQGASAWGTVEDPWGRRLRCLTATNESVLDREAVAANGGCPIFISAGGDGDFGLNDLAASADNLRSDGR